MKPTETNRNEPKGLNYGETLAYREKLSLARVRFITGSPSQIQRSVPFHILGIDTLGGRYHGISSGQEYINFRATIDL